MQDPTPNNPPPGNRIRVLIVEDSMDDAESMIAELERHGFDPQWERVETEQDYLARLDAEPDVILADFRLPKFSAPRALELLHARGIDIPFIAVSGTITDIQASDLIKEGACDFLLKDRLARLGPAVAQALRQKRHRDERRALEAALRASEETYRLTCEATTDAVLLLGEDNRIRYANIAVQTIFGYSPDEVTGKDIGMLQPERFRGQHRQAVGRFLESGVRTRDWRAVERTGLHRDGHEFPLEVTYTFLVMGGRRVFAGFIRDITERSRAQAALSESEERFRATFEQAGVGMALRGIAPRDSRWLRVNQKLCEILGYSQEELLQLTSLDITPPEDRDLAIEHNEKLMQGEAASYSREKRYVRKDGTIVWVKVSLTAVNGPDGRRSHVVSVIEDISFRREAEEKLRRLSRVRTVFSETNAAIVRVRNSRELFQEACRIAVERGTLGSAWIGSLDQATLDITPVAWAGEGSEEMRTTHSTARDVPPRGQGAVSRAVRERRAVVNNDLLLHSFGGPRRDAVLKLGFQSMIALPLFEAGAVVGTFTLYAREPGFFDNDEIALLTELAGNVSFALDHIARQQRIDKLSRIRALTGQINAAIVRSRNRQNLFDETCRIAVEHGGFGIAWIGTLEHRSLEIRPVSSAGIRAGDFVRSDRSSARADDPMGQGVAGRAVRERKAIFANDILAEPGPPGTRRREAIRLGLRSRIGLPLQANGEVAGVLVLYAMERDFFTAEELTLLEELAGHISFALEHMARQDKIEKLSRIRLVMGEINAAIIRIRDRQGLFDETCRIAAEAGGFPLVWIGHYDRDGRQILPVAWAGAAAGELATVSAPRRVEETTERAPGVTAIAVLQKKAVIVNDVQSDARVSRREMHLARGIHSLAVLPLLVADEVAGVIALHARETGFFDDEEVALLFELAGDIALALQTIDRQEKLDYLAYYDSLTGLPNRTLFLDRAGQQLRARGGEAPLIAVILLNIERFRNINESFGRHGGDEVLKLVAQRLQDAFHGKDYLARTSADAFGVVIRGARDAADVAHTVESKVMACFRAPFTLNASEVGVAARAGIAMFPADGDNADALFQNAEAALKRARDSGERYLFYAAEMNARAAQALSLETRLRKAVERQQFVLHYQPKIKLSTGAICGLEALIRWQEPGAGLVAPGAFIPVLEETGLIIEAGKWALGRALADHREWTARGFAAPRIAVNVSAIQLQRRDFADSVIEVVRQEGANPGALELEVTESLLMRDVQASIHKLAILRGLGIHIAMDDFGTGYSSLSYIARLPIDSVKIDRSFVNGMANGAQDMAIVTTIMTLARSLNLRVVAEGVETEEQASMLKLMKCDEAQGFLYSKPLPATEIGAMLRPGTREIARPGTLADRARAARRSARPKRVRNAHRAPKR